MPDVPITYTRIWRDFEVFDRVQFSKLVDEFGYLDLQGVTLSYSLPLLALAMMIRIYASKKFLV